MLKDLFNEQRQYIDHFFDHVDIQKAEEILKTFSQCKGLIVFTGIGKSGIIAEKIAMTLTSTGTKALYLAPTNFLHGDIGILNSEDLFVMISKSGETEELLNLLPYIKKRQVKTISIVSNPQSRLAKISDLSIFLPVQKELCPFDLAPTTSTAIQLIFGDVMAVALMKAKEFSLDQYIQSHPSGSIGKKMTLKVEDIMIKGEQIPICNPHDRLSQALIELSNKKCGCQLIVDEQRNLLGIFTDGDLRRSLQCQGSSVLDRNMHELMTHSAISIGRDLLAWDALKIMQKDPKRWVMVCPVLENNKVVGIIRMHDIIQAGLS
ncbi:MAG TPA: KpsF/GutQ family sugar-phosphate isomerase [Rhabdochlamydiaceae bacterium]|nr:KpsF/GutQ family sugar-phosphate isomerase [Rhabdochlamydiaceae bacterium]